MKNGKSPEKHGKCKIEVKRNYFLELQGYFYKWQTCTTLVNPADLKWSDGQLSEKQWIGLFYFALSWDICNCLKLYEVKWIIDKKHGVLLQNIEIFSNRVQLHFVIIFNKDLSLYLIN